MNWQAVKPERQHVDHEVRSWRKENEETKMRVQSSLE